jgi:hypothetical protein
MLAELTGSLLRAKLITRWIENARPYSYGQSVGEKRKSSPPPEAASASMVTAM